MIADAYRYAESGGKTYSYELQCRNRIETFGVHAVMGRPVLYEHEMRRMAVAKNVVDAYEARAKAVTWSAWVADNEEMAEVLHKAQVLTDG